MPIESQQPAANGYPGSNLPHPVIIPAYQAASRVGAVLLGLRQAAAAAGTSVLVVVIDDGSTDGTSAEAERSGAVVLRHPRNLGKGAALRTGLVWADAQGHARVVTADADGQHPVSEILRLCQLDVPETTLVLGVRNLARAGAPTANQFSNAISNAFLSWFMGLRLRDTQCGLRSYPVKRTLALGCRAPGYAFEAEVLLRAQRASLCIEQTPITVLYPPKAERLSHFHVVRDPWRIVVTVLRTLVEEQTR